MNSSAKLSLDVPGFAILIIAFSGITLGLSSAFAALVIGMTALVAMAKLGSSARINVVSFWILAYLIVAFASGILFGGFASIQETSVISWIGNEGRAFLYFWPAIFVLEVLRPSERPVVRAMRIITLVIAINVMLSAAVNFSTFGTHHAAGAFSAMVVFFHYFRFDHTKNQLDLAFLVLSVLALLGSNSRTSLLAVVISIVLVNLNAKQVRKLLLMVIATPVLLVVMSSLFPYQFERLSTAVNQETLDSLTINFQTAYQADAPIEVGKAWDLSGQIDLSGSANVAIRGYLFGRTVGEFVRSPIMGIGFGRVNDLGREFTGVPGLIYSVQYAGYPSPTDQTAHNTYLQVLAELGLLGAIPLFMVFWVLWRGLLEDTRESRPWARTGKASIICLLIMGLMQHSFGAPIYGLSLFLLASVCYRHLRPGQLP